MRDFPSERMAGSLLRAGFAVLLLTALAPRVGTAQVRDVVSKEIAVGRNEASLHLELQGDRSLDVAFRDGVVEIAGEDAGRFEPGGELEGAWRELLGTAVALDDGPLARALVDWQPPSGLQGDELALARRIDGALESALAVPADEAPTEPTPSVGSDRLIRSLLGRTDQLAELGEALEGLRLGDVQVRVGEDVRVEPGAELDATLVAVDSDVEIEGTVRGDVVVVSGTLRIGDEGRVTGDVRLADSRLLERDGTVEGSVTEVSTSDVGSDVEARDRLREELRRELRNEIRSATRAARVERDHGWSLLSPLRAVGRGFAGLLGTLVNIVVLALLGWGVVFFAPDNLAVVAETARRSPGRSAVVGMAGAFMLLPVWVLGGLALVLTLVGIFALPFWILLFPLAVAAATLLGFFAAASGVGEWMARRRFPFLDWVRSSNRYTLVAGGVLGLMVPFLLAHLVEMAVFLGFLEGLLTAVGWMIIVAATCVGFGAVLLTRAGRRPEFYRGDAFDDDIDWTGDFGTPAPGPSDDDWFGTGAGATPGAGATADEGGVAGTEQETAAETASETPSEASEAGSSDGGPEVGTPENEDEGDEGEASGAGEDDDVDRSGA